MRRFHFPPPPPCLLKFKAQVYNNFGSFRFTFFFSPFYSVILGFLPLQRTVHTHGLCYPSSLLLFLLLSTLLNRAPLPPHYSQFPVLFFILSFFYFCNLVLLYHIFFLYRYLSTHLIFLLLLLLFLLLLPLLLLPVLLEPDFILI